LSSRATKVRLPARAVTETIALHDAVEDALRRS